MKSYAIVVYFVDQDGPSPAESHLVRTDESNRDEVLKQEWLRYFGANAEQFPEDRHEQEENLVVEPYADGPQDNPTLRVSCKHEDHNDSYIFATPVC